MLVTVNNIEELNIVLNIAKKYAKKLLVLGNGSNLLINDYGVSGIVLTMSGEFKKIEIIDDTVIRCGSAVSLSSLCLFASRNNLSGLAFAYGIPGTTGGAAFMNAGAYGREMSHIVTSCEHISLNGEPGVSNAKDLNFAYRHSSYKENKHIITNITFSLEPGSQEEIQSEMEQNMQKRREKQPLEFPSAGSVFKRPNGDYASRLIEQCNLKGVSVGDAAVSEKHAGFIINKGNATCRDVMDLIHLIQHTVKKQTGFYLETEIILIE